MSSSSLSSFTITDIDVFLTIWYNISTNTITNIYSHYNNKRSRDQEIELYTSLALLPDSYRTYIENYRYNYIYNQLLIEYSKLQEYSLVHLLAIINYNPTVNGYHCIDRIFTILASYKLSTSFIQSSSNSSSVSHDMNVGPAIPLPKKNLLTISGHWIERLRLLHLLGIIYELHNPLLCNHIITSLSTYVYYTIEEPLFIIENTLSHTEYLQIYNNDNIYTMNNNIKWNDYEQIRKNIITVYTYSIQLLQYWNNPISLQKLIISKDYQTISTKLSTTMLFITTKKYPGNTNILSTAAMNNNNNHQLSGLVLLPYYNTILQGLHQKEDIYSNHTIFYYILLLWELANKLTKKLGNKSNTHSSSSSSSSTMELTNNQTYTEIINKLTNYECYEILCTFLLHNSTSVSGNNHTSLSSSTSTSSSKSKADQDWITNSQLYINQIELGLEIFGYTKEINTIALDQLYNAEDKENIEIDSDNHDDTNDEEWEDIEAINDEEAPNDESKTTEALILEEILTDNESDNNNDNNELNDALVQQPVIHNEDTEITINLNSIPSNLSASSTSRIPKLNPEECDPDTLQSIHESTKQLLFNTIPYMDIILYLVTKLTSTVPTNNTSSSSSSSLYNTPSLSHVFSPDIQSILHKIYHLREKIITLFFIMEEMGIMIPDKKVNTGNNEPNSSTATTPTEIGLQNTINGQKSLLSIVQEIRKRMHRREERKKRLEAKKKKRAGNVRGNKTKGKNSRMNNTTTTITTMTNTIPNYYPSATNKEIVKASKSKPTSTSRSEIPKPSSTSTSSKPHNKTPAPPPSAAQRLKQAIKKQKYTH